MFWILFLVSLIVLVVVCIRANEEFAGGLSVATFIVGGVIAFSTILGVGKYPTLVGSRAKVLSLKSEIKQVRESYYKSQISNNQIIGGSIENMKQSTNLSLYISDYAKKKAKFNEELETTKTLMTIKWYWLFGNSLFYDKRINDIEML